MVIQSMSFFGMVSSRDLLDRFVGDLHFGESKAHFESPGKKMLSQILTC